MNLWIKKLLGITILEDKILNLENDLQKVIYENETAFNRLNNKFENNSKKIKDLQHVLDSFQDTFRIGADISVNEYDVPWAVVCFGDKNPQVHFINLCGIDPIIIKEHYIDFFKGNKVHIDTPRRSFFSDVYNTRKYVERLGYKNNKRFW